MNKITTLTFTLFVVIIIVFSTFEVKYNSSNNKRDAIPIDLLDNRTNSGLQAGITENDFNINSISNNTNSISNNSNSNNDNTSTKSKTDTRGGNNVLNGDNKVLGVSPKGAIHELWHLPEKDEYMTSSFREQIDNLHNKYFRDISMFASV